MSIIIGGGGKFSKEEQALIEEERRFRHDLLSCMSSLQDQINLLNIRVEAAFETTLTKEDIE